MEVLMSLPTSGRRRGFLPDLFWIAGALLFSRIFCLPAWWFVRTGYRLTAREETSSLGNTSNGLRSVPSIFRACSWVFALDFLHRNEVKMEMEIGYFGDSAFGPLPSPSFPPSGCDKENPSIQLHQIRRHPLPPSLYRPHHIKIVIPLKDILRPHKPLHRQPRKLRPLHRPHLTPYTRPADESTSP